MKHTRQFLALLLALVLTMGLCVTAFADDAAGYKITVTNDRESISISGKEFTAYKIFDVTYSDDGNAVAYTVSSGFEDFVYTVDGASYSGESLITYLEGFDSNSAEVNAFAKAALDYAAKTSSVVSKNATVPDGKQTVDIALDEPGYYLVAGSAASGDQEVTAACSLTTAMPTASVHVKADLPSIDKKVKNGEEEGKANTAAIGDRVDYVITSKVPNMTGYNKYFFVMNDTMSAGLTYNADLEVTLAGTKLTEGTDYTVTVTDNEDGTTGIKVVFNDFIKKSGQAGQPIELTYSATLNEKAVTSAAGNSNSMTLTYSNNPNEEAEGENEPADGDAKGITPASETKTYVTGIKLTKVDGQDASKKLTGAKFSISGEKLNVVLVNQQMFQKSENGTYYRLKDGTYTETAPVFEGDDKNADLYDSTSDKYELVTVVTKETVGENIEREGYVDANGVLCFDGLGEGTYKIKELVAPEGYNLLKEEITIAISANATAEGCTWTVTKDGVPLTADENGLYGLTVENNAGTELPSTGGIGTTIFYVLGSVMALGAVILLVTKKRMAA